ncbi:MAG: hypothetical protein HYW65_00135 [Candidatus Liptonbacteria bacterium]|nr:hypothetical protein [Candidatus Liptonbacteria bacterium]
MHNFCGYAWGGEVVGWVEFGPLTTSNLNDGVCSRSASTPYRWVKLEGTIGGEIGTSLSELATIPPTSTVAYDNTWKNNTYHLAGWAWSSTIGWMHMAEKPLGTCGKDAVVCMAVGDDIGDKVNGRALKGYAWSPNIGWVKFDEPLKSSGEDYPDSPPRPAYLDINSSVLKGWARVCSATVSGDCNSPTGDHRK